MTSDEAEGKLDAAVEFLTRNHEDVWLEWGYLSQQGVDLPEEEMRECLDLSMVKLTVALVRGSIAADNGEATVLLLKIRKAATRHFLSDRI